jgi:hypothetical protein
MCLKVVEQNQHRDIIIKEGEVKKKKILIQCIYI